MLISSPPELMDPFHYTRFCQLVLVEELHGSCPCVNGQNCLMLHYRPSGTLEDSAALQQAFCQTFDCSSRSHTARISVAGAGATGTRAQLLPFALQGEGNFPSGQCRGADQDSHAPCAVQDGRIRQGCTDSAGKSNNTIGVSTCMPSGECTGTTLHWDLGASGGPSDSFCLQTFLRADVV